MSVDPAILAALQQQESRGNYQALGQPLPATSSMPGQRAVGAWQLTSSAIKDVAKTKPELVAKYPDLDRAVRLDDSASMEISLLNDPRMQDEIGETYFRILVDRRGGNVAEALKDYVGRGAPPYEGHPNADQYASEVLQRATPVPGSAPAPQAGPMPTPGPSTGGVPVPATTPTPTPPWQLDPAAGKGGSPALVERAAAKAEPFVPYNERSEWTPIVEGVKSLVGGLDQGHPTNQPPADPTVQSAVARSQMGAKLASETPPPPKATTLITPKGFQETGRISVPTAPEEPAKAKTLKDRLRAYGHGDIADTIGQYESTIAAAEGDFKKSREAFAAALESGGIDPERLWKSKSGFQRVMLGIGQILGAGAEALTGVNAAATAIQKAVDADIRAQEEDRNSLLHSLLQRYGNSQDAFTVARNMLNESIGLGLEALGLDDRHIAALMKASASGKKTPAQGMVMAAAAKANLIARTGSLEEMHSGLGHGQGLQAKAPWGSDGSDYEAQRHTFVNELIFQISGKAATDIERKAWIRLVPSSLMYRGKAKGQFKAIRDHASTMLQALDQMSRQVYGQPLIIGSPEHQQLAATLGVAGPPEHLTLSDEDLGFSASGEDLEMPGEDAD